MKKIIASGLLLTTLLQPVANAQVGFTSTAAAVGLSPLTLVGAISLATYATAGLVLSTAPPDNDQLVLTTGVTLCPPILTSGMGGAFAKELIEQVEIEAIEFIVADGQNAPALLSQVLKSIRTPEVAGESFDQIQNKTDLELAYEIVHLYQNGEMKF